MLSHSLKFSQVGEDANDPMAVNGSRKDPISILGAGSLGLLCACSMRLADKNYPIRLLLRPHNRWRVRRYGEPLQLLHSIDEGQVAGAWSSWNKTLDLKTSWEIPIASEASFPSCNRVLVSNKTYVSPIFHDLTNERDLDTYVLVALKSLSTGIIKVVDVPCEILQPYDDVVSSSRVSSSTTRPDSKNTPKNSLSFSNILLTTKAQDATTAIESAYYRFDPNTPHNIIVLSNGTLGVMNALSNKLSSKREDIQLISASTTHGAHRGSPDEFHQVKRFFGEACYTIVHAGVGRVYIEESSRGSHHTTLSHSLSRLWHDSGLAPEILSKQEMNMIHWKKLTANCVINPLTALRKCLNGQLLADTVRPHDFRNANKGYDFREATILSDIIQELSHVALAEMRETCYSSQAEQLSFQSLNEFVKNVIRDTAENRSSMLQDVENKRLTEIHFLNGFAINVGEGKHGLRMEANRYILREILRIESDTIR